MNIDGGGDVAVVMLVANADAIAAQDTQHADFDVAKTAVSDEHPAQRAMNVFRRRVGIRVSATADEPLAKSDRRRRWLTTWVRGEKEQRERDEMHKRAVLYYRHMISASALTSWLRCIYVDMTHDAQMGRAMVHYSLHMERETAHYKHAGLRVWRTFAQHCSVAQCEKVLRECPANQHLTCDPTGPPTCPSAGPRCSMGTLKG